MHATSIRAYAIAAGLLIAIFGAIGLVLGGKNLLSDRGGFQPPAIHVVTGNALVEQRQQYIQAVGTLQAQQGVDVTSETSGQVTEINFQSGYKVEKGQLLLVLNDEVEQAARASQAAALNLARLQYKRDEKLLRKKSISQTQLDQSRSALEQATAQLAETEARLAQKRIKAPFSGTVGIREVDLGGYVSPGTVIVPLQNLSTLELDFTVPAQSVPLMEVGAEISFHVSAYPDKIFSGAISALNSRVDTNTRNLKVRAHVAGEVGLLPGMFAEVEIQVGAPQAVITVPETAINYSLHGNSVYVVEVAAEGKAVRSQIVKTGEARNGRVAILSGLDGDAEVVTAGQNKLYPGAAVIISEDGFLSATGAISAAGAVPAASDESVADDTGAH